MLPKAARLRSAEEFRETVRGGVRVGRPSLVVHALRKRTPPSRAGFVVSKAVGGAVVRNRTKRQLRHLMVPRLEGVPFPVDVVVRAVPSARPQLAEDLGSAWDVVLKRLEAR